MMESGTCYHHRLQRVIDSRTFPQDLHTDSNLTGTEESCLWQSHCFLSVPVCAVSGRRSQTEPSQHCRLLHTPGSWTYQTSGTNADWQRNTFKLLISLSLSLSVSLCLSPQVWSSIHQVKHLRRVQQLFEASQELDTLIVSTFRVDKDEQRTGAGWRTRSLPETWTQKKKWPQHKLKFSWSLRWITEVKVYMKTVSEHPSVDHVKLTIRVDAVESRRRDDGHFTLTQRTLRGQLLLTAWMHLQDRGTKHTSTNTVKTWLCLDLLHDTFSIMLTTNLDTLTTLLTKTLFWLEWVFHKKIPPHDAIVLLELN